MKTAHVITVTTAEIVVSIKDESGSTIMKKTFSMTIPEGVSEQMTDMIIMSNIEKNEYRLANTVMRTTKQDGTIVVTDYIDRTF